MQEQQLHSTLALAGVCQVASLVQQVARKGENESEYFEASILSLVITNPDNTEQVFGGLNKVKLGLVTLEQQLSNKSVRKDAEITRYVASVLGLERKLMKKAGSMDELATRIGHIQRQQSHIDLFSAQMMTNLASVYSDVVSPLAPKIQVAGNPTHLQVPQNQQKVRALLLAGVRAAVLWRQLGGNRRNILFRRRQVLTATRHLLSKL